MQERLCLPEHNKMYTKNYVEHKGHERTRLAIAKRVGLLYSANCKHCLHFRALYFFMALFILQQKPTNRFTLNNSQLHTKHCNTTFHDILLCLITILLLDWI